MGEAEIVAENQRQWACINDLTAEVKVLNGTVAAQNATNAELLKLLKKALSYEFYVILVLVGALVYGAIGKDGLFAVRQTLPIPGNGGEDDKAALAQPLAPPPDNKLHATPLQG